MGWIYEYLKDELVDELEAQLGISLSEFELDDDTIKRVEYGWGVPEEGTFKGKATLDLGEERLDIHFKYKIEAFLNREGWEPFTDYRVTGVEVTGIHLHYSLEKTDLKKLIHSLLIVKGVRE